MCEKQAKINELEKEIEASRQRETESHQREAELFKTLAEALNHQSQTVWRPWQVIMVPVFISVLALIAALIK